MDVREKLVEQAISHFSYGVSHDIFSEPVTTYAKLAIEALKKENGVTVQEWISVDDRLPEESGNYIVCCDDSFCSYGEGIWYSSDVVVVSEYYKGSWIWYEGGTEWSLENIVTHWMPLPQPPKGE